jgi:hypothetical protein
MPGLDPGIHALAQHDRQWQQVTSRTLFQELHLPCKEKDVDGRVKPGHDEGKKFA